MRELILVQGMHRSGTSAVTRAMEVFGAHIGTDLLEPADDNPLGFFEDRTLQQANEWLLENNGCFWDSLKFPVRDALKPGVVEEYLKRIENALYLKLKVDRPFVFKDPRMCRLWPLWLPVMKVLDVRVRVVWVLRHPFAVAQSLRHRNNMPAELALLLWRLHNEGAYRSLCYWSGTVVFYEDLLKDAKSALRQVGSVLDMGQLDEGLLQDYLKTFLKKEMNHFDLDMVNVGDGLEIFYSGLYAQLRRDISAHNLRTIEQYIMLPGPDEERWTSTIKFLQEGRDSLRVHALALAAEKAKVCTALRAELVALEAQKAKAEARYQADRLAWQSERKEALRHIRYMESCILAARIKAGSRGPRS